MKTTTRAAILTPPTTADEETRSVELIIASEAITNGLSLKCKAGAVTWPAVVPVMLDHLNEVDRMAGRIESIRFEGDRLIGTAVFSDAPAAEIGWQLARSGCAVSVGASYSDDDAIDRRTHFEVPRWRLDHAALVAQPADTNCVTRSKETQTPKAMTDSASAKVQESDDTQEPVKSRSEVIRQNQILRSAAAAAKTDPSAIQLAEKAIEDGTSFQDFSLQIVRSFAERVNRPVEGGGRATYFPMPGLSGGGNGGGENDLETVLRAKLGDKTVDQGLKDVPLFRAVEAAFAGHPAFRGFDFRGSSPQRIIERAYSTSDFANFLESASNRTVLSAYNTAPQGLRALSRAVHMSDFRPVSFLRLSEIGAVTAKPQGGVYQNTTLTEELAATVTAREFGRIVTLTRRALINDDLGAFGDLGATLGRGAARAEGELLAAILAAFTFTAANSATGAGVQAAITAGTVDLRRQVGPNGELLQFEPGVLVVAPEQEADARQVLADYQPTTAAAVAPFRNLLLEIDAQLPSGTAYMADTNYLPLVLGSIGAPAITMQEDFDTGSRRFRVQHDFGAGLVDARSIVKLTIT